MRAFSLKVLASETATQTPVMRSLSLRNAPVSSAKGTSEGVTSDGEWGKGATQ